ncbi:MAG: J domain-containing protein [Synechococcales bacterium]|nr:J domain-containing protein [Synechococcales bacterium]
MNLANCYQLLGLSAGASFEEIKASYRRLARQYHPDVNPEQHAQEKFIQLTEAYQALLRSLTAAGGGQVPPPSPPPPTKAPPANAEPSTAASSRMPPKVQVTRKPPTVIENPNLSEQDNRLKRQSYDRLQQLLKDGRFPMAIALIEGLAQRIPTDLEIRQWQAITYQRWARHLVQQRQFTKARIYLKKALRTDPHTRALWQEVKRDFRRMEQAQTSRP